MLIFCFMLLLLSLLALGFLLWPVWRSDRKAGQVYVGDVDRSNVNIALYRERHNDLEESLAAGRIDAGQYQQMERELELSLLSDASAVDLAVESGAGKTRSNFSIFGCGRYCTGTGPISLYWVALLLLPMAPVWYWYHGASQDVEISNLLQLKYAAESQVYRGDAAAVERVKDLQAVLAKRLTARLKTRPDNTQYHYLQARTAMSRGRYADAVRAYQEILQRESQAIQIMAELAQAQFLVAGNRIDPVIDSLVERVLSVDARNTTALGLAGISAFEKEFYIAAIGFWRRAVAELGKETTGAQALQAGIAQAQKMAQERGESVELVSEGSSPVSSSLQKNVMQAAISVYVSLSEGIEAKPEQTVFVYAKAWQGSKMPLAIVRLRVSDLPKSVVLDDSMAMAAGMGLSSVKSLQLVARVSQAGTAVAASGDWQGDIGPISLRDSNEGLTLRISRKLP